MDRTSYVISSVSIVARLVSILILLIPSGILILAAVRLNSVLLVIGTIGHVLGSALLVRTRVAWRPPTSAVVIALYLVALGWLWFASRQTDDPFARFGRGLLLLISIGLVIVHDMTRTGLEPRRRARVLSRRLTTRTFWPRTLAEYAYLPEVRALYAITRDDPSLVFDLFHDPRSEVHTAALMTLQDRPHWRWEEAAVVIGVAKKTLSPAVRELAIRSLASSDNTDHVTTIGEFLKDPTLSVRGAACECLLAGGERRWAVTRNAVRAVLADPAFIPDGPLPGAAGRLSPLAVCDLSGWAVEPAPLAERAVRTLLAHYEAVLRMGSEPGLSAELGRQVTDHETPPILRVELASLLRNLNLLPPDLLDRMTDADQPSPIRLNAVEVMLANNPDEPSALDVLRGLGRQTNRETALAIARILQQYAQMDFGLPANGVSPRIATEVAQRVQKWALGKATGDSFRSSGHGSARHRRDQVFGTKEYEDDEDALGGLPESEYPASIPGMSSPRHKPRSK
jgi:hypothetical protein